MEFDINAQELGLVDQEKPLKIELGDTIVWENRDYVNHIISFNGVEDREIVDLDVGQLYQTEPFLVPGEFTFTSHRTVIHNKVIVQFKHVCLSDSDDDDDRTVKIVVPTVVLGSLLILLLVLLLLVVIVVVVLRSRRKTRGSSIKYGDNDSL